MKPPPVVSLFTTFCVVLSCVPHPNLDLLSLHKMKKRRAMKRREFTDDGIYIRARESAQESHGKQPEAQTGDETEKVVVFGMETSLHLRIPERVKTTTQHLPYVRDGLGHSLQDQRDEVVSTNASPRPR